MTEWESVRIGDVADVSVGFAFKSARFSLTPPGHRLVRGDNVKRGTLEWGATTRYWSDWTPALERYLLREGDVLVGMDGSRLGENFAVVSDEDLPALLVQRVACLRSRAALDQGFLRYLICNPLFTAYVKAVHTGTSIPHISSRQIGEYTVRLPPLAQQRAIAGVLRSLDDKIDSNLRLANSLQRLARVEFRRLFGGHIEGTDRLGDYVSVTRGRSYKSAELEESDRALVTLKSVRAGGGYNPEGLKPYTGDYRPDQIVHPGDLVVAHTDLTQNAAVVGKPALIADTGGFSDLVASLDLAVVRPTTDRVSVPFLYHLFFEPSFQQHAYGFANGSTVLHLSKEAIPSFAFSLPDPQRLAEHDLIAHPCLEQTSTLAAEGQTIARVRNALLPKLVSGRIRVPDTDDPEEVTGPEAKQLAAERA